jgi:MYXO-CTERM domain-containing protein
MTSRYGRLFMPAAIGAALLAAGTASADLINIFGDGALGDYTGSISYDGGTNLLVISLTNTSAPANGGFITGVIFNINSADALASAALTNTTDADFLNTGSESGAPFGTFDAGAALGANWLGGGNPNDGIAVGGSVTLTFLVSASDRAFLTASSFINNDVLNPDFVVRFRGFEDGGSDKVPGQPGPAALGLMSVAGMLSGRRRRQA